MKSRTLILFSVCLFIITGSFKAQNLNFVPPPFVYYAFDKDSLQGFDETAARLNAIQEQFLGSELKVRMYQLKRQFINDKFNLTKNNPKPNRVGGYVHEARMMVSPGCDNEDFEAATGAVISTTNQIQGWVVSGGSHTLQSGSNSCNQFGCCPNAPLECELIDAPTGTVDPTIGSFYPIYSVFGSTPAPAAANAANPQIAQGMFGSKFIRINSNQNNYSMARLTKTFSVSPTNAVFQFAFISVFSTGHGCCDAGAFKITLYTVGANNSLTAIPCPQFTASALSSACSNTNNGINFLQTQSGNPATLTSGLIFNKWQISSLDLTPYLGQTVQIEITTSDCTAGGHFGYVYFDAQCGPMTIYGNGSPYAAGSGTVTVPTCGAAGATICAQPGLGPYSWAGPNVPQSYQVPSYTNQCFVSNISANYTLIMSPPGACVPITRVVASTITPAPLLYASVQQATCNSTKAVVSVTPAGSASTPSNVTWLPAANATTTAQGILNGTYTIPAAPNTTNYVVVSAQDPLGCKVSATVGINAAPPTPTFNIVNNITSALLQTASLTCNSPTLDALASTNYNYNNGALSFTWQSGAANFFTQNAQITLPGTYIITGMDPNTLCPATRTLVVVSNTTTPNVALTPTFQNITCSNTAVSNITVNVSNLNTNVSNIILTPLGGSFVSQTLPSTYPPGSPGVYTLVSVNGNNGCTTTKQFTVSSNDIFPTFGLVSPQNFTLGCSTKSVATIQLVNGNAGGGPVTYTIQGPPTSSVLPAGNLSPNNQFTVNAAGTWTAVVRANVGGCTTKLPFTVIDNKFGPSLDTLLVPRIILTCDTPSVDIKAISITPNITSEWSYQTNVLQSNSITVSADFTKPNTILINTYTIALKDNSNLCITTRTINIYQNIFTPSASIVSPFNTLSCKNPTLVLTNNSKTKIPANTPPLLPPTLPVIGYVWMGPPPSNSLGASTTYTAQYPGTYTITAKDLNNGCVADGVIEIKDGFIFPQFESTDVKAVLDCGKDATISLVVTSATTDPLSYTWTPVSGAETSTLNGKPFLITNLPGTYPVLIENLTSGCIINAEGDVTTNNNMTASLTVNTLKGTAPLTIDIKNLASTGAGDTSKIASIINYGNGSSATFSYNSSTSTTYNSPGTYTITVYSSKGSCLASTQKIIVVDAASSYTVPNIFTPNNDGVNDLFFIRSLNMKSLKIVIFDRTGNIVYQNKSEIGNDKEIIWDGKTPSGTELPPGTYFYILQATKADGKSDTDIKGTITLTR